ncbi:unnamed protein product [Lactuca saligna]|uniref:GAE domain-containing protein n=1 Tax=Lactuca saligna TaxID=75948 RepID=A0AA35YWJ0_LACSI|nr:unnamed protein product [Lactuca saligna]
MVSQFLIPNKSISIFPILSCFYLPLALTDSSPFLEINVGHLNSNPLRIPTLIHSQKSKNLVVYPTVYRFKILGDRIVPYLWFVAYTTASLPCSTLICPNLSVLHHLLHMVMFMNVLKKEGLKGHKEWLTEVNFLVQLRHPNLVKLISALDTLSSPIPTPGASPMMDQLDGFGPNPTPPPPPKEEENGRTYPPIVAFEVGALSLIFNLSKQPGSPQITLIKAKFTNQSSQVYTNFIFHATVPKIQFIQLHLEPASSNTLPGNASGSITQKLRVNKNQHGKKSVVMHIRISYKLNNKDMLEEGQISNFPCDL